MPRIAVARLWFEANSFAPDITPLSAFQSREWVAGSDARRRYRDTATELGGLDAFLRETGWDATILRCTSAQPGGPMADDAFALWWEEVAAGLAAGGFDGVYLSLHGACITQSDPQADLTIIRLARGIIGPQVPMVASFDMHANIDPGMALLLDGASAYRSYPHTDMADTAWRALRLLKRRIEGGRRLHASTAKLPRVLHSFHMRSEAGPFAELWAAARAMESATVPEIALFGGFAWGDTPSAGPAVMAWAESDAEARAAARAVMGELAARVERLAITLPQPRVALAELLAAPPGLVALLDPADNPLSGGACDTPGLLQLLLEAAPPVETVLAFLHDPEGVAAAQAAGEGGALQRPLGGRTTPAFGPPAPFTGTVEKLTAGQFRNEGPMEAGSPVDLGATAVLRAGTLRVILTSRKEAAVDPAFFALHGIELGAMRLLANKAKNHFRAAFATRCVAIQEADFPGPAALDLAALPFRHVPAGWRQHLNHVMADLARP